jgi:hypothetical protein
MRNFFSRAFAIAGMLALAACGGGDGSKFETPGDGSTPPGGNSSTATTIVVQSSASSIASDGSTSADITALLRDTANNFVPGATVTFEATSGGIAITQGTTDTSGAAKATLTTAGDTSLRTITVTAKSGSLTSTVNVQVVSASASAGGVQLGSLNGSAFMPGILSVGSTTTLSAGGSTSLQVALQKNDGTLYLTSSDVTFSSPCIAQGLATVSSPVTTTTGIAQTTYVAKGCTGTDVITASSTVSGGTVTATGSVTIAAASVGSIVFDSASFTNIALKGTGSADHPESSTIVFRVLDQSGGPRANAAVSFALNTSVGGLTLSSATGTSDANGRVQTVVQGGTVATTVRVTATVLTTTPPISTQSNLLTVTTGIPDQDSFSLAVTCPNVEAWNRDGEQVDVTARLSDRFNNPVPKGTAVTFTTEGGSIQSNCATDELTDGTPNGECVVKWTSSNPRPPIVNGDRAGRSSILATAIGEESFDDANGNGSFDNGENFVDLGEPYVDADDDGAYTPGERIYDFNNNSTHDGPDGKFNGVLCLDTSGKCDATLSSAAISAKNLIIMSGSTPFLVVPGTDIAPSPPLTVAGSSTFTYTYRDVNKNPLPHGTIVSAEVAGTGFALSGPTSFTVPCTDEPTDYGFTVTKAGGASTGTLTVTVKTPSGLETPKQYALQ